MRMRWNFLPVKEASPGKTRWLQSVELLFNLSITEFLEDLEGPSFETPIWRYLWCFWGCPKPSCARKQKFSHMVSFHPFAKLHHGSEVWINAMNNNVHLFVRNFFVLFWVPNAKKITIHASIKILFLLKINILWIRTYFTNLCSCKNVQFKFWYPVSKEHNYGKFSSKIKSKDRFKIRIVPAFKNCPKLQS